MEGARGCTGYRSVALPHRVGAGYTHPGHRALNYRRIDKSWMASGGIHSPNPKSWHMATKKRGPTLAALNAQIAALQAQADALRKKEVAEVVAKIKDAIVHYGLTAADLGLAPTARKNARTPEARGGKLAIKGEGRAGQSHR